MFVRLIFEGKIFHTLLNLKKLQYLSWSHLAVKKRSKYRHRTVNIEVQWCAKIGPRCSIVFSLYYVCMYIFVVLPLSSWTTLRPVLVLMTDPYLYTYFCFMNHNKVFVNFPNLFKLEDWQYISSCYPVVGIIYIQ